MAARASRLLALVGSVLVLAGGGLPGAAAAPARPLFVPPAPPTGQDLAAARYVVTERAAAAAAAANRVAAAKVRLNVLRARAETLIERYDGAMVALHAARSTLTEAEARLTGALRAQAARRAAVGQLASVAYQTDGQVGPVSALIGAAGPVRADPGQAGLDALQAYADRAGTLRVLGQHDAEILAASQASSLVAQVFRGQARAAFQAVRVAARAATAAKDAAVAAVARQELVLEGTRAARARFLRSLTAARAREQALASALAAAQADAGPGASWPGGTWPGSPWPGSPWQGGASAPGWAYANGAAAAAGDIAANWALSQLGKPYVWAAAGPDAYDCSGLTMRAWQRVGIQLDHWTGTQWTSGPHVPLDQLRRGDLVFFADNTADPATIHHVGIYIGRGMMVNAPYTGAFVRIDSIYEPGLIGATRPAG